MIIAIPVFENSVAPCFEAASIFMISCIENGECISTKIEKYSGCEGYGRVKLLRDNKVEALICNGIKGFYQDLLQATGLIVIPNVATQAEKALLSFISGELKSAENHNDFTVNLNEVPHDDLVCWARQLFSINGYKVVQGSNQPPYLIDLIAEIDCPVCHKTVRVAICCGSHTYRADQEICEFYHTTLRQFQARVFVHPATPAIRRSCMEYGIEFIDPDSDNKGFYKSLKYAIPLLRKPIPGHERAFQSKEKS